MVGASKSRLYRRGIVRSEQMRHARLIHDMRVSLKKWGGATLWRLKHSQVSSVLCTVRTDLKSGMWGLALFAGSDKVVSL